VSLKQEIELLQDQMLAELSDAHDYYADTRIAWDIVQQAIATGQTFRIRNRTTGTVTTEVGLPGKARSYISRQLAEATFQQFIAIFESFFVDLLGLWLTAHPRSLGSKKVDFRDVLEASDKAAIISRVVNREVNVINGRLRQYSDMDDPQYHRGLSPHGKRERCGVAQVRRLRRIRFAG